METLLAVVAAVAIIYVWLIVAMYLYVRKHHELTTREVLNVLPQTGKMLASLVKDKALPRRAVWLVALLGLYLVMPIDIVPDFLPIIGWADDVIVILFVIRTVVRWAGKDVIAKHWQGTDEGLKVIERITGL